MQFFSEDLFATLLMLERKRCERSGERFALALFDVSAVKNPSSIRDALCTRLRETDLAGWYKQNEVMGAIFTTLNGVSLDKIRTTLHSKIREMVDAKIPYNLFIFPEDITPELYPDKHPGKHRTSFHIMKRGMDILGSLLALILLSPFFLGIAMAVKLSSPGPVIFRQKRLGHFGKEFDFLKFRSMRTGNDSEIHRKYVESLIEGSNKGEKGFKIRNDPRVTRVGHFLRRSSLDELPQFVNVLKGEMSLVGPRPPIPYEMDKYRTWHKRRVLEVKPGITGLWQVRGRSRTTFDDMVRLDIQYINEQSLWLDLKILLQTPRAVLSASGAY